MMKKHGRKTSTANIDLLLTYTIKFFRQNSEKFEGALNRAPSTKSGQTGHEKSNAYALVEWRPRLVEIRPKQSPKYGHFS